MGNSLENTMCLYVCVWEMYSSIGICNLYVVKLSLLNLENRTDQTRLMVPAASILCVDHSIFPHSSGQQSFGQPNISFIWCAGKMFACSSDVSLFKRILSFSPGQTKRSGKKTEIFSILQMSRREYLEVVEAFLQLFVLVFLWDFTPPFVSFRFSS